MAVISNSPALVVPSGPPPEASQDIRGIKPPLELADGWSWLWWTLVVALVMVVAWLAYRKWRAKAALPVAVPVTPPHVIARQRLQRALESLSDPKVFCTEVSDTIRVYLEDRFRFHAPERTTEEFLLELSGTDLLLPDQKESLGEFLQVCDLVKFARHEPNESTLQELHNAACRLVDETRFEADPPTPAASSSPPPPSSPTVSVSPPGDEIPSTTAPRP